jgi:transcriptional regulator with XRE-family HTH domain
MPRMRTKSPQAIRPARLFGERVRTARDRQRLSLAELSAKTARLGKKLDSSMIARIERGETRAALEHVMLLAAALGVAPVHLITPQSDDTTLYVAPKFKVPAPSARAWVRGEVIPPGADALAYFAELPVSEQQRLWESQVYGTGINAMLVPQHLKDEAFQRVAERLEDYHAGGIPETKEENDG